MVGWLSDYRASLSIKGKRLFSQKIHDYLTNARKKTLRLFQKLLRLFQPERYDYCSPLLAIGRKPEKRYGDSRQGFRAAPPRPCCWTTPPGGRCRADPVQVEALTPQQVRRVQHLPSIRTRQELTPPGWHGSITRGAPLHPYIPYYNRRLR